MKECEFIDSEIKKHPKFKLFKSSLKLILSRPPASLPLKLLKNYEQIITSKEINISKIVNEKELEQFKKFESPRYDIINGEYFINNNDNSKSKIINNLIKCFDFIYNNIEISENTREYNYKKVEEVDEDIIMFSEDNTISDLQENLFYNVDVDIEFNKKISKNILQAHGKVQTCKFNVNNLAEYKTLPTKYSVKCTYKTPLGECGNVVEFCDIHKHSTIMCSDSLQNSNQGHKIKSLESAQVIERKKFYRYIVKDLSVDNEQEEKEFEALSVVPIENEEIICNCILSNVDKEEVIFILAVKKVERKKLDNNILIKDTNNITALDDIFESIKRYYKTYHKFHFNNTNKYIAKIIIFQCLANLFYKQRFHSFFLGKSGSGKSLYSFLLFPMFSFNYQNVSGIKSTRNRFLGGQDRFKNYLPGYASSQDFVFLEEASSALNFYHNAQEQKFGTSNDNLFEMLKEATADSYNTGQQGSRKVQAKASFTLVGNLEHLELLKNKYLHSKTGVVKQYRKFSDGKDYDFTLPLFKPLEYYSKTIGDDELAKAHAYTRISLFNNRFFATGLPEAEQARFIFMVVLEEDRESCNGVQKIPHNVIDNNNKNFKVHRKDFLEELDFLKDYKHNKQFQKEVEDFYYDDFLVSRNNYLKTTKEDLNNHIKDGLFKAIYYFIIIEKLYWKEEFTLNDNDKKKVKNFFRRSYNSLNLKESSEKAIPFFNDFKIIDTNNLKNLNILKNEEYYKKKQEERQIMEEALSPDISEGDKKTLKKSYENNALDNNTLDNINEEDVFKMTDFEG